MNYLFFRQHILVKMHHREKMSDQCSQGEKHTKMTLILIKKLFQKTDILMVNVGISWFRSLKSEKGCQIWIQRVEKRTEMKIDEKMRWDPLLS